MPRPNAKGCVFTSVYFFLGAVLLIVFSLLSGCLTNPRVTKCHGCGLTRGVIGGHLPLQGIRCGRCDGRVSVYRHMTRKEWNQAKEDGFASDGVPEDPALWR